MALTLYGGARTRASMPRWYMEEKGIAYDWRMLDMQAGEHKQEPFLSINPFGKLPALVHEDPALPSGRLQRGRLSAARRSPAGSPDRHRSGLRLVFCRPDT